ncbi:DUF881 domain-containing protein [Nocardioides sp. R-C-SC26]|uniref:DUF881 domain-containing protein n=1 Tax=Nocardioides sp. R-C-SC26 TaxID=2870414 RepID=UPI001E3D0DCA|nr:DUF881 domain-containing protein [Nocardioides sp. R-C-SC26]
MPDATPDQTPDPVPDQGSESERASAVTSGRSRLGQALLRPSRTQTVVGVLLAVLGFAFVVQVQATRDDSTYSSLREQDLIDVLNGLAGTTQRTQTEIDQLTETRSDLRSESSRREAALNQAQQEVDSLNVLAGLVPVTGPGVRVTITEVTGTVRIGSMLDLIQELRTVGAEAIQINGTVRVVAQTSFELGVGGLVVDGTLVEPPYVVDAIGVANTLRGAVLFPLGPRQQIRRDGGDIAVDVLTSLDIDAVRQPVVPEFAQPTS